MEDKMHLLISGNKAIHRHLYLIIGGIAAGVLLICSIAGYFLLTAYNAPSGVASAFYTDIQHQNFTGAYQNLDSSLKAALSEQTFINLLKCTDTTLGAVTSFSTSVSSNDFTHATVLVSIICAKGASYVDQLSLTNEQGGWLITQSQDTFPQSCQAQQPSG